MASFNKFFNTTTPAKPWNHGIEDGTDYAGCTPQSLGADIAFHERGRARDIIGLRVRPDEAAAWRHYLPAVLTIVEDPGLPTGCAYLIDHYQNAVAFVTHADLSQASDG